MEINEELKKKMLEYLAVLEKDLKTVKDFSAEQVPLLVQEYLNWIFWENCFGVIVCIVLIAIVAFICRKLYKKADGDATGEVFTLVMSSIVMCAFFVPLCIHFTKAAKVHIAPRVVIIEKIAQITK